MTNIDSILKSRDTYFANKGPSSQSYGFPSGRAWIWELDCEESWALKNWCFWTVVLEKTLESSLDCKEIQPVHPKGEQSWVFMGSTDAKPETPVLCPPHVKSWLIGKDPDAGRDWGQEEKGTTKDEMAEWHHCLDGHEFEWTLGFDDGQGVLACCDSFGLKESDTTEWLHFQFSLLCIGEGNCNPLQCSYLENPRDGRAWWAAVYKVAQSRTWLKRHSSSSSNVTEHYVWLIWEGMLFICTYVISR